MTRAWWIGGYLAAGLAGVVVFEVWGFWVFLASLVVLIGADLLVELFLNGGSDR